MAYVTPGDKRVCQRAAVGEFTNGAYRSANAADGPPGSAVFTTAVCLYLRRDIAGADYLFAKGVSTGWSWTTGNSLLLISTYNSTPANVNSRVTTTPYVGGWLLCIATYVNGTTTLWANGVQVDTDSLGAGYTPQVLNVSIGCRGDSYTAQVFDAGDLAEGVFMDAYDANATYPGGVAALSQQWMEDMQQNRYLTPPRVPVIGSDYNWSARDAVSGPGCIASWLDRWSALALVRGNVPQGSTWPARF